MKKSLASLLIVLVFFGCGPRDAKISGSYSGNQKNGFKNGQNFSKITGAANNKTFDMSQTVMASQHEIIHLSRLIDYALNPKRLSPPLTCLYQNSISMNELSHLPHDKSWSISYRHCKYTNKNSPYYGTLLSGKMIFNVKSDETGVKDIEIQFFNGRYRIDVKTKNKNERRWAEVEGSTYLIAKRIEADTGTSTDTSKLIFNLAYQNTLNFVQKTPFYMEPEGHFFADISGQVFVDPQTHMVNGLASEDLKFHFFRKGQRNFYSKDKKSRQTRKIFYDVSGVMNFSQNQITPNNNRCAVLDGSGKFAVNVGTKYLTGDFLINKGGTQIKNNMSAKWFKGEKQIQTPLLAPCSFEHGFYPHYFLFD